MDNSVKSLVKNAIKNVVESIWKKDLHHLPQFVVDRPKRKEWGDLSTNLPFLLSTRGGEHPESIGEIISSGLSREKIFSRVEFASPGFINLSLSDSFLKDTLKKVVRERENFTVFSLGEGRSVQVEFVSANPTGPLHVGHGRAAALGDAIANNLGKLGYKVYREYYVNDIGGQIKRLARSLWIRMRQIEGEKVEVPEDGYRGEYLVDIAKIARERLNIKEELSDEKVIPLLSRFVVDEILKDIRDDLDRFGVRYDRWFFESELYKNDDLSRTLSLLEQKGLIYEKDGALWFKTSSVINGEQDRVLRRKNGEYTYFASDIAYHQDKLKRGFYRVVDIWGADHIGYVPRIKAVAKVLGYPEDALKIIIYQLVTLKRGGRRVSASTRAGEFISLKELLDEVGRDAARFFFLSRSSDSHLDFDLELAKKQTPENPVFYVQYAHARICSILRKAEKEGIFTPDPEKVNLNLLTTPEERDLMLSIALLPDQVKEAGENLEPHHLTGYLQEIASLFHYFYTRHRVITNNRELSHARLFLIQAVKIVIADLLGILGISAPERM